MKMMAGILARVAWEWLFWDDENVLREPSADYGGLLDGMEASELLALLEKVQERLNELQGAVPQAQVHQEPVPQGPSAALSARQPVTLFINKSYNIRLGSPTGTPLPLRPLVKSVFILFLKHPEGILLKERAAYESELNDIYAVAFPNASPEVRHRRIRRLVDQTDNSFSEKASELNSRLGAFFQDAAGNYQIQGSNGHPRRIPLDPLLVCWEDL